MKASHFGILGSRVFPHDTPSEHQTNQACSQRIACWAPIVRSATLSTLINSSQPKKKIRFLNTWACVLGRADKQKHVLRYRCVTRTPFTKALHANKSCLCTGAKYMWPSQFQCELSTRAVMYQIWGIAAGGKRAPGIGLCRSFTVTDSSTSIQE